MKTVKSEKTGKVVRVDNEMAKSLVKEEKIHYVPKKVLKKYEKDLAKKVKFNTIAHKVLGRTSKEYKELIKQIRATRINNNRKRTRGRNVQVITLSNGATKVIIHK